ncbi:Eukaryotic aspartyl protease family protein [Euphorbia peplus]|nr:Eukaryotic aspartyl protease family protein [Euphorbia peplus]
MELKTKNPSSSSSSSSPSWVRLLLFFFVLGLTFQGTFSATTSQLSVNQKSAVHNLGSSFVLPVSGNVYPLGYYFVSINIGNQPKPFELDIDSGSDLTWVQCDAPCKGCTKPIDRLYKPKKNVVPCLDPRCSAIQSSGNNHCEPANDQCHYEIQYADAGSSLGVLVVDNFPLKLMNGSLLRASIAFGCGYDQKNPGPMSAPPTAGVLGLGNGKASIISQLKSQSVMKNVIGHCFSRKGGGYLSFGDGAVPSSGITWTPMVLNSVDKIYAIGPAEVIFGGKPTGMKGLQLIFDSGSSYSYFASKVYEETLNLIKKELSGKPLKAAPEEKALSVCWKGAKRLKSVSDVKSYFKPLAFSFYNQKNSHLEIPPENYLIVTENGNVCLGILNGTEVGLGNFNVVGDIFFQDKMVIYDNEKNQIGWVPANCDRLPKADHILDSVDSDWDGLCRRSSTYGILEEDNCPSFYSSVKTGRPIESDNIPPKNKRQR